VFRAFGAIAVLCVAIATASCGGNSTPSPTPPLNLISRPVPAGQGGTLVLPSGTSVVFPPGSLGADVTVSLSQDVAATPAIPVRGWASAPGTMTVAFSNGVSQPRGVQNPPHIILTLAYDKNAAPQILLAQAPVIEVSSPGGKVARISADATFDGAKGLMSAQVSPAQIAGATKITMYAAVDAGVGTVHYGPRYWYPAQNIWSTTPFAVDPAKRTIVMVHGIFSSVETAFPCEQTLLEAGAYTQALGLDYDWTQPPGMEAPLLASLINALPVSTVDIEAHSYGTVITLAALPQISKKIGHVVLLGGPLPLHGAPQADPGYLRDLLLLGVWIAYPSEVHKASKSGMIAALATNSKAMQAIWSGLQRISLPPFVQVAGGSPLSEEVNSYPVYALYKILYGATINDGVVEQQSATQQFAHTMSTTFLSDDHLQLECDDPSIISYVGSLVHP
jgi:pimeloyl-ACP methyl ester carboxylesterase